MQNSIFISPMKVKSPPGPVQAAPGSGRCQGWCHGQGEVWELSAKSCSNLSQDLPQLPEKSLPTPTAGRDVPLQGAAGATPRSLLCLGGQGDHQTPGAKLRGGEQQLRIHPGGMDTT